LVLEEYFEKGDMLAALAAFNSINKINRHEFRIITEAVKVSIVATPHHREMVSNLITARSVEKDCYWKKVAFGLTAIFSKLTTLTRREPKAPEFLGNFIARAVATNCIPLSVPEAWKDYWNLTPNAMDAVDHSLALLNNKDTYFGLYDIWDVGVSNVCIWIISTCFEMLITEFLETRDREEAFRFLRKLNCPEKHYKLVWRAIIEAQEAKSVEVEDDVCLLLSAFFNAGVIDRYQMRLGFMSALDCLDNFDSESSSEYSSLKRIVATAQRLKIVCRHVVVPSTRRVSGKDEGNFKKIKIA